MYYCIHQFMHLSNNSSLWTDRVGAAFGVGHLVKSAGKELEPYLSSIIPRIYRYQFDPNLKVQQSMSNIWSIMVPKPKETIDKYLAEIVSDLKDNIHHKLWRTRESCSNAFGTCVLFLLIQSENAAFLKVSFWVTCPLYNIHYTY